MKRHCSVCGRTGHDKRRHETNPEFFTAGGKVHPIRGSKGYSEKVRAQIDRTKKHGGPAAAKARRSSRKFRGNYHVPYAGGGLRSRGNLPDVELELGGQRRGDWTNVYIRNLDGITEKQKQWQEFGGYNEKQHHWARGERPPGDILKRLKALKIVPEDA